LVVVDGFGQRAKAPSPPAEVDDEDVDEDDAEVASMVGSERLALALFDVCVLTLALKPLCH
jgi:hypothetical protein